jgi:hypothetical protein
MDNSVRDYLEEVIEMKIEGSSNDCFTTEDEVGHTSNWLISTTISFIIIMHD